MKLHSEIRLQAPRTQLITPKVRKTTCSFSTLLEPEITEYRGVANHFDLLCVLVNNLLHKKDSIDI